MWDKMSIEWYEKIAKRHIYYHIKIDDQCKQGSQRWCSGTTQRDGVGREVEGVFRMGDTCTPMADSCRCMAKTTTIL